MSKTKGSIGERALLHQFWKAGWACVRIAGSGSTTHPAPDLLAGNGFRRLAIECKVTSSGYQYLTREEIEQLRAFAGSFGAEAWVSVRFSRSKWYFFMLEDLRETEKFFVIEEKKKDGKGLVFEEVVGKN